MTVTPEIKFLAAPMQGFTEAPFRHFHAGMAGGVDCYVAPFLRIERGEIRRKDLRDITSPLNANHRLLPQIIFRDLSEFDALVEAVTAAGYRQINLNLGCPFPPQVKHGRGAGTLLRPDLLADIGRRIAAMPDVEFSAKMRLGVDRPDQWRDIISIINSMPLSHLTVHPRTARQQYSGPLDLDQFAALLASTPHPVIFNGDIATTADIARILADFPAVRGIMAGRGLLANPWLAAEMRDGIARTPDEILRLSFSLHDAILDHYLTTGQGGDHQVLARIKPLWEYLAAGLLPRTTLKSLRKSATLPRYRSALSKG